MASLLTLPNELLQNLACYLPFSSLVKLQYVNQRLHHVCNQRLVLQAVALNGFCNTDNVPKALCRAYSISYGVKLETEQLEWREGDLFLSNAPFEVAREIARVVEICTRVLLGLKGHDEWTLHLSCGKSGHDVSKWLPHLLALHHHATLLLEPQIFLRVQDEVKHRDVEDVEQTSPEVEQVHSVVWTSSNSYIADIVNVNFILSYVTLQRLSLSQTLERTETIKLFENSLSPVMTSEDAMDRASSETELIENTIRTLHEHVSGYDMPHRPFTPQKAYSMLPPMILRLSAFAAEHLPNPRNIPFLSFMDVASVYRSPFGRSFSESFSKCHLREMTSPAFITGNWIGYCTDVGEAGDQHGQAQFDSSMRDICITTSPPSGHAVDDLCVSAKIDARSRGLD
jgi:hypothetical protein